MPTDTRAATILQGRYLDPEGTSQLLQPAQVIAGLVDRVFRIRTVLDVVAAIIAVAALAALGLALFLSCRLRAREIETASKIGARRGAIARLLMAESAILVLASGAIALVCAMAVRANANAWVAFLLTLGS